MGWLGSYRRATYTFLEIIFGMSDIFAHSFHYMFQVSMPILLISSTHMHIINIRIVSTTNLKCNITRRVICIDTVYTRIRIYTCQTHDTLLGPYQHHLRITRVRPKCNVAPALDNTTHCSIQSSTSIVLDAPCSISFVNHIQLYIFHHQYQYQFLNARCLLVWLSLTPSVTDDH